MIGVIGLILGIVLVGVLLFFLARFLYMKFWLEHSEKHHKCPHCGEVYQDQPFYCPHCGEVVDQSQDED
ncbi:type II toxin-antitoxin system MqsA family antitoxin [Candidatus Bipolaricaulota bacterium]|nr:type II toxin-antitoxin system MqsA family antitoxin [Candidatus Bipolaricaulota bacterium]